MTTGNHGDQPGNAPYGEPQYPQPQYGQPQYGQPQYGQPQYGQPQYGAYGAPAEPAAPAAQERFGVVAATLAAVAAVLGVLALTVLNWFSGGTRSHFSDVRKLVTSDQAKPYATGVAKVYYGWLAWVLLAVVVVVAVVAAAPQVGRPFRLIGAILAVASIVVSFLALKFLNSKASAVGVDRAYSEYLKQARVGFWMLIGAFVIGGIAAAFGAQRPEARR